MISLRSLKGVLALAVVVPTLLAGTSGRADELVTALSSEIVSIQSNFTGTEIVIFGQMTPYDDPGATEGPYDLAIVVEGPAQDITTRRKGRFLGVWVNRDSETFQEVPAFYAVASTRTAGDIAAREILEDNSIGLNYLNLAIDGGEASVPMAERYAFRKAFLRLREEQGLYSERPGSIEFLTNTMFRTTVPLPANIPVGIYKVKSFLFRSGDLLSSKEAELAVAKMGFEQVTYNLANKYPLIYGILAVTLAVFTGWLAGVIFRKD